MNLLCNFLKLNNEKLKFFLIVTVKDGLKKRPRTAFTANQIKSLENEFEKSKYLSVSKRLQLSKSLNLTETQVFIHFN